MNLKEVSQGVPLGFVSPNQTLMTDVSKLGWGAVFGPHQRSGLWSREESLLHVNPLETLAVFRALQAFEPILQRGVILLQTNNTTVMAYINKMGGTRSLNSKLSGRSDHSLVSERRNHSTSSASFRSRQH